MNERIQELIARAEMYADEQNKLYGVSYSQTLNEKLAELIVRECADTVLGFRNQFGDSAHVEIKQHFGVEE
jgi:hypothetical protein